MAEKFFWDAVSMEDHNTTDMGSTTVGAPLKQAINNPSLAFRRFAPGEARGVAMKFYMPDTLSLIRLRFCSRIRSSDDPVIPVTTGNMRFWIGFRNNPDFLWRFTESTVAHPSQTRTDWQSWTLDLPYVGVLAPINVNASFFYQMSVVRKGDHAADTASDTQWDLMCLQAEIS
jgi:hypothetical protein